MLAGTFAVAVFHAQRNGAQMESGLFGKLERPARCLSNNL
jgi:hypothetical protein